MSFWPSLCLGHGYHVPEEFYDDCREDDHSFAGNPAPPPIPPVSPHEDHAPTPPDEPVAEFNVLVTCPCCGIGTFGTRYETGDVWTNGHWTSRVPDRCEPLPVVEQTYLEVA